MSREIKFRAWVFDDYSGKRKMIAANQIKLCGDFAYVYCAEDDYEYQINTPDLSQFTGLLDRSGREIYEGDIVRYDDFRYDDYQGVAEVGFRRIEFVEEVEFKGGCFYPVCTMPSNAVEVIGNIYENPELLK